MTELCTVCGEKEGAYYFGEVESPTDDATIVGHMEHDVRWSDDPIDVVEYSDYDRYEYWECEECYGEKAVSLEAALDGLLAAEDYCYSRGLLHLGEAISHLYQSVGRDAPDDDWEDENE